MKNLLITIVIVIFAEMFFVMNYCVFPHTISKQEKISMVTKIRIGKTHDEISLKYGLYY